jgi:hypothetical protein
VTSKILYQNFTSSEIIYYIFLKNKRLGIEEDVAKNMKTAGGGSCNKPRRRRVSLCLFQHNYCIKGKHSLALKILQKI